MTLWMITGSSTDDGAPIYLQADGRWVRRLADGLAIAGEDERERLLAEARSQQRTVCDPYAIVVARDGQGRPAATSLRERIRAEGPTVALPSARVDRRPRPRASA